MIGIKINKTLRNFIIGVLAIVLVGVIVGLYTKKDLLANKVNINNMEFSTEGFVNYLTKDEPIFNSNTSTWWIGDTDTKIKGTSLKPSERAGMWWIGENNTNIPASMLNNKIVAQNDKFIMFIDEMTTIVTVVDKTSLIANVSGR